MRLFATDRGGIEEIPEIKFKKESDLRRTVDQNPALFFPNFEPIGIECKIKHIRIDALAFDREANAFVIIEYKKGMDHGVLNQVLAYKETLKQNQNDCVVLLMNKRGDSKLNAKEIDWQKTRMIIVGTSSTTSQIYASSSVNIELYEIHKYLGHLTVSKAVVKDNEPSAHRPRQPGSDQGEKPSASYTSFNSSIIFSVFEDGKTHTLSEVYAAVEESCAQKPISTFRIRQRVRARIKALCAKNTMVRVDKSTYRLTSDSGRTDKQQPTRVGSTKDYSEKDWLDGKDGSTKPTPQVRDLYFALNRALLVTRHLERIQNKRWASYRLKDNTQVCSIVLHKNKLEIVYAISKGDILLPKDFVHDISDVGHYGKGDYRSYVATQSDASRVMKYVVDVQQHLSRSGL